MTPAERLAFVLALMCTLGALMCTLGALGSTAIGSAPWDLRLARSAAWIAAEISGSRSKSRYLSLESGNKGSGIRCRRNSVSGLCLLQLLL